MKKKELINVGENQYLSWSETLYEDKDFITYEEWGYSKEIHFGPGIDDDVEYIIKINKKDLGKLNFEKLFFVLKNFDTKNKIDTFRSFLENKKIKYEYEIW